MAGRKRIALVTGGAGRLGRTLASKLVEDGYEVRCLIQRKEDALEAPPGTIPYLGDITDEKALADACAGVELVIHLAAIVSEYRGGPKDIMKTNVLGTRRVVDAAKAAGARRLLFASSTSVYGRKRRGKLNEDSETGPSDTYGQSKVLAEKEVVNSGLNYTIFRIATIYGPGFEDFFLKMFGIVRQGRGFMVGKGENHIPLVHINDVVRAFQLALEEKVSRNKIYIITDGRIYTQREIVETIATLVGVPTPEKRVSPLLVRVVSKGMNLDRDEIGFLMTDKVMDISRARKQLGFRPKKSLESDSGELLKEMTTYEPKRSEEFEV
jgi:nucleoside-diphosphate-sugar epimerase